MMYPIRYIFVISLISVLGVNVSGQTTDPQCSYKYYADAKGWLKLHRIPANWRDARLRCQLEGGVLASPLTWRFNFAMRSLAVENRVTYSVFTGIHATVSKGDYATITGIPLSKIPHEWATNEPNNLKDEEQCIVMLRDGTFADANCKSTFPYMCYKEDRLVVLNDCGTTDPAYKLDARTGKCYKFHRIARSFSRSNMACMAEGGHLAIINSEAEAGIIRDLFINNPPSTMVGTFLKNVAFLGFYDWNERGEWRTVHGYRYQNQQRYHKPQNKHISSSHEWLYCVLGSTLGALDRVTSKCAIGPMNDFQNYFFILARYIDSTLPDGSSLQEAGYTKWSQDDPNNSTNGEYCGACFNNALIIDIWCENVYPFICEKDPAEKIC